MPKASVTLFAHIEDVVAASVQWLKLGVELIGAFIIAVGIVTRGVLLGRAFAARPTADFTAIRLTLARYLALEFQLGADSLSTAIAPSWTAIGKLGAITVIRTVLNPVEGDGPGKARNRREGRCGCPGPAAGCVAEPRNAAAPGISPRLSVLPPSAPKYFAGKQTAL